MLDAWLCTNESSVVVDDLTTEQIETKRCVVEVEYKDGFALVNSNGIPNHDYESTLGCCASEMSYQWKIPIFPEKADVVTYSPERGPVAISVNGVPFYGPEDGPGGDAVASYHDYYEEDRQEIVLGLCGGHSGPGGTFHYHYDGNCVHWHPEQENKNWIDWIIDLVSPSQPSSVIGFAFDGYPIYGPYGYGNSGYLQEMRSSYRLKDGKRGYGGIDDWEYVAGLGDLDECNGINSKVKDMVENVYHYHSTKISGSGEIGFPYFILCYSGVPESTNFDQDTGIGPGQGGGMGAQVAGQGQMPQCRPANPPPGMQDHPVHIRNLPACPDPQPGQGGGRGAQVAGQGQMPQCRPANPPPGMQDHPVHIRNLPACPDPQPGQGGGMGQGMTPVPILQPAGPGYIGLAPHANVSQSSASLFGSPVGYGIVIAAVSPGGPASGAGMQIGDVIVNLGGMMIINVEGLISFLNANGPGSTGTIGFYRNGQYLSSTITLGIRP
jgi:hypothetical protein